MSTRHRTSATATTATLLSAASSALVRWESEVETPDLDPTDRPILGAVLPSGFAALAYGYRLAKTIIRCQEVQAGHVAER